MQGIYIKSPILKILIGILATMITIVSILLVAFTEDIRMQDQAESWEGRSIENGAALYATACASCHGVDGKGASGPALNSYYFFTETGRIKDVDFTGSLRQYVKLTIAAGRPSKQQSQWPVRMPTWGADYGGPYRDDQIEEIVDYVMNWEESALAQTPYEDPWRCFEDVPVPCDEQGFVGLLKRAGLTPEEYMAGLPAEAQPTPPPARPPEILFAEMGCSGCHVLSKANAAGAVGPDLDPLPQVAGERIPGMSPEEYVYQSIVDPDAHIVEGFPAGVMPTNYAQRMSEEEIRSLVDWLLQP